MQHSYTAGQIKIKTLLRCRYRCRPRQVSACRNDIIIIIIIIITPIMVDIAIASWYCMTFIASYFAPIFQPVPLWAHKWLKVPLI